MALSSSSLCLICFVFLCFVVVFDFAKRGPRGRCSLLFVVVVACVVIEFVCF